MTTELPSRIDYLAELCTIYRSEKLALADLELKILYTTDALLKTAFQKHLQFTEHHLERLQTLFADLDISYLLENKI